MNRESRRFILDSFSQKFSLRRASALASVLVALMTLSPFSRPKILILDVENGVEEADFLFVARFDVHFADIGVVLIGLMALALDDKTARLCIDAGLYRGSAFLPDGVNL